MHPWIHRVVQQLSLPFGLTEPPSLARPSRTRVEPAWTPPPAAIAPRPRAPTALPVGPARPTRPNRATTHRAPLARSATGRTPCRLRLDPQQGARTALSGRCADVCAMLERLAAQESAA
jgi:hypothetical protein